MSNIHTLGGSRKDGSDNEQEDNNDRQGFYVGGGERSGQQVLGNPGSGNPDERLERLFESARRSGAETVSSEELRRLNNEPSGARAFQGRVYRLGSRNEATAPIAAPSATQSQPVTVRITFWADGYSVDDGPLRSLNDPNSQDFLRCLERGQIPPQIVAQHRGKEIDVHLERRSTNFVKPPSKPFAGQGYRLGEK